ncbi:uncharacterized protein N7511_001642 [Penicillium nucicola]|uniref:uncharacterized protein n=1 Tax=Penicillium nucicola TaxID=1850975 RepID=UPI002545BA10|nr:uncharacterized protein N7511_001642 [Penicillium nucicola]KAJ5776631.1 hypothetical protein N7511_001642 [Penicillium nucicola]
MAPTTMTPMNMSLFVRSRENWDDPEREEFLGWYIAGWALGMFVILILVLKFARHKERIMPKLQTCKENLEDLGEKMTWKPSKTSTVIAKPPSAHVANHHVEEVSEVDRITADLSPSYLQKTTAVMGYT